VSVDMYSAENNSTSQIVTILKGQPLKNYYLNNCINWFIFLSSCLCILSHTNNGRCPHRAKPCIWYAARSMKQSIRLRLADVNAILDI
jgi:hypothetical protein